MTMVFLLLWHWNFIYCLFVICLVQIYNHCVILLYVFCCLQTTFYEMRVTSHLWLKESRRYQQSRVFTVHSFYGENSFLSMWITIFPKIHVRLWINFLKKLKYSWKSLLTWEITLLNLSIWIVKTEHICSKKKIG